MSASSTTSSSSSVSCSLSLSGRTARKRNDRRLGSNANSQTDYPPLLDILRGGDAEMSAPTLRSDRESELISDSMSSAATPRNERGCETIRNHYDEENQHIRGRQAREDLFFSRGEMAILSNERSLMGTVSNDTDERYLDLSLPRWQPDTEVSSCPICGTVFGFFHRKHHCRKCGRVVCAACSPHRITIPRQFIVRPPAFAHQPSPPSLPLGRFVDCTGEEPVSLAPSINPALGGGEEVRLCNPCVPDPNPNPPGYGAISSRSRGHRSTYSLPSVMGNRHSTEAVSYSATYTSSVEVLMI